MPIFGPGGEVVAAVELAVGDLGHELQQLTTTLSIATRSLSRELASAARLGRPCPIPHPRLAMGPTVEQATALVTEALG
jgi:hypothetical protein